MRVLILLLLLLVQSGEGLDGLVTQLIFRLEHNSSLGFRHISPLPGDNYRLQEEGEIAGDFLVYRRSHTTLGISYFPVGTAKIAEHQISLETADELDPSEQLLLLTNDRKPRISVHSSGVGDIQLINNVIVNKLNRCGLFEASAWTAPLPATIDERREQLHRTDIDMDALISLQVRVQGNNVVVLATVTGASPEGDDLFSLRELIGPELARHLGQEKATIPSQEALDGIPLPAPALAIATAEMDGNSGDEILVMTEDRLYIYSSDQGALQLWRSLSLEDIEPANYANKLPSGDLIVSGDSLYLASNLWQHGAELSLSELNDFHPQSAQPVAITPAGGLVSADYSPGQNSYLPQLFPSQNKYVALPSLPWNFRKATYLEADKLLILKDDFKLIVLSDQSSSKEIASAVTTFCLDEKLLIARSLGPFSTRLVLASLLENRLQEELLVTLPLDIIDLARYNSGLEKREYFAIGRNEAGTSFLIRIPMASR
jgi:hypothetical protein